jgi:hypothetical protein
VATKINKQFLIFKKKKKNFKEATDKLIGTPAK